MPKYANEATLNFRNETYGQVKSRFENQVRYFRSINAEIKIMWECEFLKEYGSLLSKEKSPLNALIPRDALRGGKTECYGMFFFFFFSLIIINLRRYFQLCIGIGLNVKITN